MDFSISDEVKTLRASVRRFVEEELIPLEPGHRDLDGPEPGERSRLEGKVKDLGLWALDVPKEHGGRGLNNVASYLLREETSRTFVPSTFSPSLFGLDQHPLLHHCDEGQREQFLAPVVRGEKRTAFLLTGPAGGSDPANASTSAARTNGHWTLNGRNVLAVNAKKADFVQVFAVTDADAGIGGRLTCFLVQTASPGFRVERAIPMLLPVNACEVVFENCEVPDASILGGLGRGFELAQELFTANGGRCGPVSLGIAERCQAMAVSFARSRVSFGEPIGNRQAVQFMLADSAMEMHASRVLAYECAGKLDRGEDVRKEASVVKFFSTEMVGRVADRAMQIHGSLGLCTDLPLERFWREVRALRIAHGTNEIHRLQVAEELIGTY